jgi:hypothetical protein
VPICIASFTASCTDGRKPSCVTCSVDLPERARHLLGLREGSGSELCVSGGSQVTTAFERRSEFLAERLGVRVDRPPESFKVLPSDFASRDACSMSPSSRKPSVEVGVVGCCTEANSIATLPFFAPATSAANAENFRAPCATAQSFGGTPSRLHSGTPKLRSRHPSGIRNPNGWVWARCEIQA